MRLFFVLACCLAIPLAAYAADQGNDNKKKKQGGQGQQQQQQVHQQQVGKQGQHQNAGNPNNPNKGNKGNKGNNWNNPNNPNNPNYSNKGNKGNKGKNWSNANNPNNPNNPNYSNKGNKGNKGKNWSNVNNPNKVPGWQANKVKHFNLPTKTTPTKVTAVNFQQGRHIEGSQHWQGSNYQVFRNYQCEWHDQGWWHNHYNRVVFVYGGWYAWNAGYWFPAWGYAPNAYYAYDGPIYGYNNLPPDQVIANVQSALQQQGYYQGEVDGLLGPQTRGAIADYQRANGLEETAAIDQPTLESLGMS